MIQYASKSWVRGDRPLRRDIRLLGWMLRHVVTEEYEPAVWSEVRKLREWAGRHETGDPLADREMGAFIADLPIERLDVLLRILGLFFFLANVSEDLQRERILHQRRKDGSLKDSLTRRLQELDRSAMDAAGRQELLNEVQAEFVLTAHPTEARRQSIRRVLQNLRADLIHLEDVAADRISRNRILDRMREDMRMLLRTDLLHPHRPRVLNELDRALYVTDSLWEAVPSLVETLEDAGGTQCRPVRFGCWIGGDRDGHPHVTVDVTRETLQRLQHRAVALHLAEADRLMDQLTGLCRNPRARRLLAEVHRKARGNDLDACLSRHHPEERYRHALESIRHRLRAGAGEAIDSPPYASSREMEDDVRDLEEALRADGFKGRLVDQVHAWQARVRIFGLHLMRLDIRENSTGFRKLVREVLPVLGHDPQREATNDQSGLWSFSTEFPGWEVLRNRLSERSWDLLAVTDLMQEQVATRSDEGVGAVVISMTHSLHDVLWVLWLHRLVAHWRGETESPLPIAPLFETISDLTGAAEILDSLFAHPEYARHLAAREGRQLVMIGYSDSAKDGGYLAACWALYQGQAAMQEVAEAAGIHLTCFHGRGGALGRGGGPAARAIQALPPETGTARIRMTEQGEVIEDRFVDPILAHRHMEQILGGLIRHTADPPAHASPPWQACMQRFAEAGRQDYLTLLNRPGFVEYFREATPISSIELLPIGSRPSRRHGAASLEDLRAIPYTFAWTQSRQLINAFYGLGSAWEKLSEADQALTMEMYKHWRFFRSMIDNAELALTKCDPVLTREYAGLVKNTEAGLYLGNLIAGEMEKSKKAVLKITGCNELLENTAWLQRSVDIRKPYIDVLNYIQIELLKRRADGSEQDQQLQRSLRMSVQAIAAGLRTTG